MEQQQHEDDVVHADVAEQRQSPPQSNLAPQIWADLAAGARPWLTAVDEPKWAPLLVGQSPLLPRAEAVEAEEESNCY